MTDPFEIPAHEHGITRVFAVEDGSTIDAMTPENAVTLLGGSDIDAGKVEVVEASKLAGIGLSGYLVDGYGVAADEVAKDRARLDGLGEQILLVPSSAFRGAQRLDPTPPLTYIGAYRETPSAPHEVMTPAPTEPREAEPAVAATDDPVVTTPERKLPIGMIVLAALGLAVLLILLF